MLGEESLPRGGLFFVLNQIIKLAQQYNFGLAYSNQAFEYWLFLHSNNHQGGGMDREDCCKERNKLLADFNCR